MDFLNKSSAQVADLFRSMTPGARITTGLLLAVVVISLGYLFTYQGSGPSVDLTNGEPVQGPDMRNMLAAFSKSGLPEPVVQGSQILVPQGKLCAYWGALLEHNAFPQNIDTVFDKPFNDGPFGSGEARNQQLQIANRRWLEMVIRESPNIESARVTCVTENRGRFPRRKEAKATVWVKPVGNKELDELDVKGIRSLVAAGVEGIEAIGVSVYDKNSKRTWTGDMKNGGAGENNEYAQGMQWYDRHWTQKIERALEFIPSFTVATNVTLSPEQESLIKSLKVESKTVASRTSEKTSDLKSPIAGPAGRVGYQPNSPQAGTNQTMMVGSSQSGGTKTEKTDETENEFVVPGTTTETMMAGLIPKRVSATVGVPESYFVDIWRAKNPTEAGQEPKTPDEAELTQIRTEQIATISKHVLGVLPQVEGLADPSELVTVTPFPDLPDVEIPEPGMGENAMVWLGNYWGTVGMIALAMFSLVVLRSMVRSAPTTAAPEAKPDAVTVQIRAGEDGSVEDDIANRLGRFSGSGRSLRDEVSELVNEDPDAAANILKTWIGAAS